MLLKGLNALLTVLAGIGAALVLYWILDRVVNFLPGRWAERLRPYAYILPAFAAISLYLIYPAIQTIVLSFANPQSTAFVGFQNYTQLLSSQDFRNTLFNTVLWVIFVPLASIVFGLGIAVLVDRFKARSEKVAKTTIFLPMAISAVGAATVWRFVFATNPPTQPQVGLLNGIWTGLGGEPVAWLQQTTLHFNSFLLMVTLLWAQVGFSMVLLSAAIKGVPTETIEAGRIDGANERQVFRRIIVPQIWPTVITVWVTVTIGVMKIFDIVYVMTNGNYNTNVVGLEFFNQLFTNFNAGAASAIVVMLMIAVIPLVIYQVRNFRAEESSR